MKNFDQLAKLLSTARDPVKGKPVGVNRRVRLLKGTAMTPEVIAVQFYDTDILKYRPNGDIEVVTGWNNKQLTRTEIENWSGLRIYSQRLPLFNGRKAHPDKLHCICLPTFRGGQWPPEGKHVVCSSRTGFLRFAKDGCIENPDDIEPVKVDIIRDAKKLRALEARMQRINERIRFQQQLGYRYRNGDATLSAFIDFADWMQAVINEDPDDVDISTAPIRGAMFEDQVLIPEKSIAAGRKWEMLRAADAVDSVSISYFER